MSAVGPAIVLVLSAIGLARVVKVALTTSKNVLRALGRRLATLGDPVVVAPVLEDPRQAQLGAAYERANAITIADVERVVSEAISKLPPKSRKRDPEVTEVSGN